MLTADQWQEARGGALAKDESVPSSGVYINLQDGQRREFQEGDPEQARAQAGMVVRAGARP